jgi:hypothetical protein
MEIHVSITMHTGFNYEADGKIRFCYIYFFKKKIDVLILIYLTNNSFLLQIMVLKREPKPVERFIETHM